MTMIKPHVQGCTGFVSERGSRAGLYDIWASRYLILQLIVRDLVVRYRQTWLGWAWAVINPACYLAMYYAVFGLLVRLNTSDYNTPYALVLLCGLILWMLFASTVNIVSESLLNNLHLIKKVYFPRIVLTLASTGICIMDFMVALVLLGIALPLCGLPWSPFQIPVLLYCGGLTVLCGWGVGCIFAVVRMKFRDIRHIIPLVMLGGFYATPVAWTSGTLPARWQWLPDLNPVAGSIKLFRHILLNGPQPSLLSMAIMLTGCVLIGMIGYYCFMFYESRVTDQE
ncbi:ABC transporter permease [Enterobacter sp. WCHEn045836]|uniref:ABC transporter permease n=1 Tax=Enterobacter sp. WCHEn045836 TaxID=2497434 RepID=UPI000F82CF26|nr:ABC transporter permease [Enterobacter sp. WCHEn045836]RTP97288.1 ABC transporter permease [Enterobacter sp. WCHEn045836]